MKTDLQGFGTRIEGKVRDNYVKDGIRTIVASDRVSAFDVIVGTLPSRDRSSTSSPPSASSRRGTSLPTI